MSKGLAFMPLESKKERKKKLVQKKKKLKKNGTRLGGSVVKEKIIPIAFSIFQLTEKDGSFSYSSL